MKTGWVGKHHYIEHQEIYKGVQFVVLFNDSGWRTAYINVTNLFLEKLDYMECDNYVSVHGGFTWKDCRLPFEQEYETESTWLGWDYAHYNDGIDVSKMNELGISIQPYMQYYNGHVYTLEEVIKDCKYAINRIRKE